jgi:hypothetical protein
MVGSIRYSLIIHQLINLSHCFNIQTIRVVLSFVFKYFYLNTAIDMNFPNLYLH